ADHSCRRADGQPRRQDRRAGRGAAVRPAAATPGHLGVRHPRRTTRPTLCSPGAHGRWRDRRGGACHRMTVAATDLGAWRQALRLPLALTLARREQRNGLKGFYVFITCVALGVAVITGVGALADVLRASFERQGEALLGGDVTLSRPHRPAEDAERTWLSRQGR